MCARAVKLDSSTVASMIARLSSCSMADTLLSGPSSSIGEAVVEQAEREADATLVVERTALIDEVVGRLGDRQLEVGDHSSGESGVSRQTADSASLASTR